MLSNCGVGEDSREFLDCKEIKPVNLKGNQPWIYLGRTDAEALQVQSRSHSLLKEWPHTFAQTRNMDITVTPPPQPMRRNSCGFHLLNISQIDLFHFKPWPLPTVHLSAWHLVDCISFRSSPGFHLSPRDSYFLCSLSDLFWISINHTIFVPVSAQPRKPATLRSRCNFIPQTKKGWRGHPEISNSRRKSCFHPKWEGWRE